jgi:hypothetical protein
MNLDRIRPVGRHLRTDEGFRWGWPGTGFDVAYKGRRIELDLRATRSFLDLSFDGAEPEGFEPDPDGGTLALEAEESGHHVLRVRKRTEGSVGDLVLRGVSVDGAFAAPPDPSALRLEFYGDSITCGYGCLDPEPSAGFRPETESFGLSWAGRLESLLGAEVHAQAISGIGVVRNWPGVVGDPLPGRWKRAHQDHPDDWDLGSWVPRAVVVNLGTNDFGVVPFLPDDVYLEGLVAFLEDLRHLRPDALLVVVDGPLLTDHHPEPGTRTRVRRLMDQAASRTGAHRFSLTPCDPRDGFGADWHPSSGQHGRNAREFAAFLGPLLGG